MEFCSLRVVLKCFSIIFNVFHRFFILLVQNSVFRFKIVFFRLWNDIWSRNRVWNHFVSMEGGLVNLSRLPLPPPRGGVDPQKRGSGGRFGGGSPPPFLDVFHGGLGGAPPPSFGGSGGRFRTENGISGAQILTIFEKKGPHVKTHLLLFWGLKTRFGGHFLNFARVSVRMGVQNVDFTTGDKGKRGLFPSEMTIFWVFLKFQ